MSLHDPPQTMVLVCSCHHAMYQCMPSMYSLYTSKLLSLLVSIPIVLKSQGSIEGVWITHTPERVAKQPSPQAASCACHKE